MATPAPQVPSYIKGTPDEQEYLQALIDGDTRTITAFDTVYQQGPLQVGPAQTGDSTPTPAREEQIRRDPFSSIAPAGEATRQADVEAGFGKGFEVEEELVNFTFVDPAIELPKRVLMRDLTETEQKRFRQMTEYFMDQSKMDAISAMYAARNRLRVIREAERTLPYPQPIVTEGESGKRVEPFSADSVQPAGPDTSMMGLGRQTLQTPEQVKQQERMSNIGGKERQVMETSFRIQADQESEKQGNPAGSAAYDQFVEQRVIALRRNWLENRLPIEMVQLAREIVAQEKEQRGLTVNYINGRPVYETDPADTAKINQIAGALLQDYEQGVYPPDWMGKKLGGNDPNYTYANKSFSEEFMENLFTTRSEEGGIVETRTAQTLRGIGGLIRPVTETITELTTYDVDAAGNPLDPNDINIGSFIGQPIYRLNEETGERTDLPKATLEKGGAEGWSERVAQSVARGRFLGEDYYDQPQLASSLGGQENAWILGLGVELMLPVTPMPLVKAGGKTLQSTGKTLQKAGKGAVPTLLPDGAVMGLAGTRAVGKGAEKTGNVLVAVAEPFKTAGGYARSARARKAAETVGGQPTKTKPVEGTVSIERAMAQETAANRVAAMSNEFNGRTLDIVPEKLDPLKMPNSATARASQLSDDLMRTVDDAASALFEADAAAIGRVSPVLQGPVGSRLAFAIGKYVDVPQVYYRILGEGADTPRKANIVNELASDALSEYGMAIKIDLVAQEIETLFARLNPEGYVFVTPTLVMKKTVAKQFLEGPNGINARMRQNIEVKFDPEVGEGAGRIVIKNGAFDELGTMDDIFTDGIPRTNSYEKFFAQDLKGGKFDLSTRFEVDADGNTFVRFQDTDEMSEAFGFIKGGIVKRSGGLEPMRVTSSQFDLLSQPLERQLITRDVTAVVKAGTEKITPRIIRDGAKRAYEYLKKKGVPFKEEGAELPVQTQRLIREVKNELDNIPRAIQEDFKEIAKDNPDFDAEGVFNVALDEAIDTTFESYLRDRFRFRASGLGKRVEMEMGIVGPRGGVKTGRQVLNRRTKLSDAERVEIREEVINEGGSVRDVERATEKALFDKENQALIPRMYELNYQDEITGMVTGFFGEAAASIPKVEVTNIVQALQKNNPNLGTLDLFKMTISQTRKKYPYLNKKGFGGVIDGDQFSVYLMAFIGNQKKNNIFLGKFYEFKNANPDLMVSPNTFRTTQTRPNITEEIKKDYGEATGVPDTELRQALMAELSAGLSEDSVTVFQRRFTNAMDKAFSEGKTSSDQYQGAMTSLTDAIVTRNLVTEVGEELQALVGIDRLKTSLGFRIDEAVSDARFRKVLKETLVKDFRADSNVNRYLGLDQTAVDDWMKTIGVPMKPSADLNRLRPVLQSMGSNDWLLVDIMAKEELDVLRRMTAAGSMDDAIRFYNTRGDTVGQYLMGSVGRFFQHGMNGIKGGLLGGTLAPNGRYLGVNTFTAWSITSITTPRYTANAIGRAIPTMITQFTKASERFGTAGTAGAGASFGGLIGFLAGGPLGGVAGATFGGAGAAAFAQVVPQLLQKLRGNKYSVRLLQAYGDADPNLVLYTGVDGKKYTAGMLTEMLRRNNIYRSEVTFEFGIQMLNDLKRTARLGSKGKAGAAGQFLDGAVGQVVGRKSYWNAVAEESDNAFRTQVFVDSLLLGMTEDQAAQMARVALLDYGAISPAAKQYLRPLFLFFAFSTQITKEASLAFLRADPAAANNIGRQIRMAKNFENKNRTDIVNQYADRNLARLWSYFGDNFDEYHTVHYGLQSPAIEGFYNFIKTGEFIYDLSGVGEADDFGLSPEMARQFKEKFIFGANPIVKMYATGFRDTASSPQGFLTAREALMWNQSGMMPYAMSMFNLEKVSDPEKLREGEPTFGGVQYRFKDAEGISNYKTFKTITMSMGVDRNLTDWGTTTAMAMGLQNAEIKRFKGEWYLYAIGLDTPLKAPNYLQLQDKIRTQQEKELRSFKK